jgi:hypothetical protein
VCAFTGIFVGYAKTQRVYRVYLPANQTIATSIHAKFDKELNIWLTKGEYNVGNPQFSALLQDQLMYDNDPPPHWDIEMSTPTASNPPPAGVTTP